jgi:hypothetical protein
VATTFEAYAALWRRIQKEDVYVRYDGKERCMDGYFLHEGDSFRMPDNTFRKRPLIAIGKRYAIPEDQPSEHGENGAAVDLRFELFSLAHEYGHCRSFRDKDTRDVWGRYHLAAKHWEEVFAALPEHANIPAALGAALSEDEKKLIMDEETLAWSLGRPLVPKDMHSEYDRRASHDLDVHRFHMALIHERPDDLT